MNSVALVLALVAHQMFHIDIKIFLMDVPFTKWEWPCPLKDEIPSLIGVELESLVQIPL